MQGFDVANAFVTGTLPAAWGNWSTIKFLNLVNNSLSGALLPFADSHQDWSLEAAQIHPEV